MVSWCLSKIRGESSGRGGCSQVIARDLSAEETTGKPEEGSRRIGEIDPRSLYNELSHQQNDLRFMVAASRFEASVFPGAGVEDSAKIIVIQCDLKEGKSNLETFKRGFLRSGRGRECSRSC